MNQVAQIIVGGLLQGSVFAVIAIGLSLVYRVTGIVNLAQGGFCILGALLLVTFGSDLGWPVPLAATAAVVVTTSVGLALGAATFVPALARLPNSSMLMLTAGLLTLIEGLALVVWGSQPYAVPPFSGERPLLVAGLRLPSQALWIVGVSAVVVVAAWYLLARTAIGRALAACAENPNAARLMGIDVKGLTLMSFGLTAMIGAIGGVVVAPILSLQFDAGRFFTNAGFIAVAIGGMGSFAGAVAGGLFLGVAEQLAAGYVSSLFSNALALALLLATLLWRPQGLFAPRRARRHDVRDEQRVYRAIVRFRGRGAAIAGLGALAVLIALPYLTGPGGVLSSLTIAFILFIAVLGLDVLMGYAGQVSLGQAGFLAIGGYTASVLAVDYGLAPLLSVVAGMALSLVCAVILSLVTMRLRGAYLALATLAFGLLVDQLTVGLTDVTGGPSDLVGVPAFTVGPVVFATQEAMYFLVLGVIVFLVLVLLGGMRSSFGRALQAIRTDQTAAAALGIDVPRHKMAAFAISAVLGSLAGSLYAFDFHFLSPDMVATPRSFEMIAMLVLGGEGTLVGGLVGAVLITLLPTLFQPLAAYKIAAEGAILVLAFQYLPDGLFGTLMRRLQAFAAPAVVQPAKEQPAKEPAQ
jgi:branched-chain amino acid transport system permease protein